MLYCFLLFLTVLVSLFFASIIVHLPPIEEDFKMFGTICCIRYDSLGSILWMWWVSCPIFNGHLYVKLEKELLSSTIRFEDPATTVTLLEQQNYTQNYMRHINNLHDGLSNIVSFIDYIAGRRNGIYFPNPIPNYLMKQSRNAASTRPADVMKDELIRTALRKSFR